MNTVGQHAHHRLLACLTQSPLHSLLYASLITKAPEKLGSHLGCGVGREEGGSDIKDKQISGLGFLASSTSQAG